MSTPSDARPLSVVLADDSEDMRELLSFALLASGRFTVAAHSRDGEEALRAVSRHQPDLALLDLAMPILDGLDVLAEMITASPRTRVIVVSGFPRSRFAEVASAYRALGYVEKSLSPKQMVAEIIAVAGVMETVEGALAERSTQLPADPRSSASARRFVGETLRRWDCEELLDTVALLVSELVTNSIRHAASDANVAVVLLPEALRLEVSDRSDRLPEVIDADTDSIGGRGMGLVEQLSSDWGVESHPNGKTIWFEVPRPDA